MVIMVFKIQMCFSDKCIEWQMFRSSRDSKWLSLKSTTLHIMKKRFKNKNWKTGYEKFSLFYGQKNVNLLDMYG